MSKKQAYNRKSLRQARRMSRKIGASEIASLTVSIISAIAVVGDVEPFIESCISLSGLPGNGENPAVVYLKFIFTLFALILSAIILVFSLRLFFKEFKSFKERKEVCFYADIKYYKDVIQRIRKIHQDNVLEDKNYSDVFETVHYNCDSRIEFDEDWYFYNPHVNAFLQNEEKLNSIVSISSVYKYKIPNICKQYVPFILYKEVYGQKDFYNLQKLRLNCDFSFALPLSEEKEKLMNDIKQNEKRIFGKEKEPLNKNLLFFGQTTQFDTHCTNDIAFKKVRSIEKVDEELVGDTLFIDYERVAEPNEKGILVEKKMDKLCRYSESPMSNQVGCSSLLITSDNKVVIRRQKASAGFYGRMLVPSGSTSVNSHAYGKKDRKGKSHVIYKLDKNLTDRERKCIDHAGQHIIDLPATLKKCATDDLMKAKFKVEPDYVKIIGFLKVVFRGNLPDFSCLSYTSLTANQVVYMKHRKWYSEPTKDELEWSLTVDNNNDKVSKKKIELYAPNFEQIEKSGCSCVYNLDMSLPDGGLLKYFTVQDKNPEKRTNDSISIQLHAILKFLNDNPTLLKDFIEEAQAYRGRAEAKRIEKNKLKKGSKK